MRAKMGERQEAGNQLSRQNVEYVQRGNVGGVRGVKKERQKERRRGAELPSSVFQPCTQFPAKTNESQHQGRSGSAENTRASPSPCLHTARFSIFYISYHNNSCIQQESKFLQRWVLVRLQLQAKLDVVCPTGQQESACRVWYFVTLF